MMVFRTRHAYAVSSWRFLMMMTGCFWKNAASSGQNSSLMSTTLFDSSGFLLASTSFSVDLIQHHDLQIRLYHWHHFGLFWYSIIISGSLLPLTSFPFFTVLIQHHPLERKQAPIFWLPARGGANMQEDKRCTLGWAGKQKEAPRYGRPQKAAGLRNKPVWTVTFELYSSFIL